MENAGQAVLGLGLTAFPGLFCLWHAWRDTDWFFNNSQAAFWVDLVGRKGALWFYGGLGVVILLITLIVAVRHFQ